jgi:hypothetical protein
MEKDKDSFLSALQHEILRHNFDTFVDNPPSVAQGGRGCVVPGCVPCRKRLCQQALCRLLWGNSEIAFRQRRGTREKLVLSREGDRTGIYPAGRPRPVRFLLKRQGVQGWSWGFFFVVQPSSSGRR